MKTPALLFAWVLLLPTVALADDPSTPWRVSDRVPPRVRLFDLADVRLAPGPFLDAQNRDAAYLLNLSPDRLLHGFRKNAGLEPKGPAYDGWESRGLGGHSLGHYLSACAMMAASTGDARFRDRVAYIVHELAACQTPERAGLLSGFPDDARIFAEVAAGQLKVERFGLNGGWVPWYNLHKTFAGLRDAVVYARNEQALVVLRRLADWAEGVVGKLNDEQMQRMLYAEHGGMNESLADVYALTGDERYLTLSQRFWHREVLEPLAQRKDQLDGYHANTQIPKIVGAARLYELTGDPAKQTTADFFWHTVVEHRSWVIGGNSESEHFFPPATAERHLTASTAETCNTYNMLRLTEHLYGWTADARLMDYFERALYNHILASQDPQTGMCTYFVSLRPGAFKYYHDPEKAFWCCTGSGMENHAKYTRGIYAQAPGELYVNLFIPSSVNWREGGVAVSQRTDFPRSSHVTLTVSTAKPASFKLKLRVPAWLAGPMAVRVNDETIPSQPANATEGYVTIEREWRDGDRVEFEVPMALRAEPLAHSAHLQAFLYGPLVLAGELGADGLSPADFIQREENAYRTAVPPSVPALVSADVNTALAHIHPVPGRPLTFRTEAIGRPNDVTLIPFYQLHRQRHVVYWSLYTPADYETETARESAAHAREQALAARTVDTVACAEQQLEVNHGLRAEKSDAHFVLGLGWRSARPDGWFEYTVQVPTEGPAELLLHWWGEDVGRSADVLIDGAPLAVAKVTGERRPEMVETTHAIPTGQLQGKSSVVVRIRANSTEPTPRLLQLRTLRARGI